MRSRACIAGSEHASGTQRADVIEWIKTLPDSAQLILGEFPIGRLLCFTDAHVYVCGVACDDTGVARAIVVSPLCPQCHGIEEALAFQPLQLSPEKIRASLAERN